MQQRSLNRKKICGIYKITSPSGKVYIGQSVNIKYRWSKHKSSNAYRNKLYSSFKKYGHENHKFEIIHELPHDVTKEILDKYEEFYIERYEECGFKMLNLTGGGLTNKKLSKSTRRKLSKAAKGNKNWLGKKHTEETKKHLSEVHKGTKFSEQRKKNISLSLRGISHTQSEETKRKIRDKLLGRTVWNKGIKWKQKKNRA